MTIDQSALVTVVLAFVGGIVWLVRLEGHVKALTRRLDVAEVKVSDMDSTVVKELAKLREEFAELKGYIKATHKEI